jgi:regulator of sigma E protease
VIQVLVGALSIIFMFLLLVAPHEGGHFALAKLFGVRVLEFSVGMGNRVVSRVRGGTLYALRAIPLGGYVRLSGMEPGDYADPDGFHHKPAYQRLLILAAGPFVNFLVAGLIMTAVYAAFANPYPALIAAVDPGSPAAQAGLVAGDRIVSVDGKPLQRNDDIVTAEQAAPGAPLVVGVIGRDGGERDVTVTPRLDPALKRYIMGIHSRPQLTTPSGQVIRGPGDALLGGVEFPYQAAAGIVGGIAQLVSGQIPGGVFGPEGATGPIGIAAITYQSAQLGIADWLTVAAALSVALGLANLLPLPALDGGRMVVVVLEKLRGRPFDRERELAVQRAGLVALLVLVAFIAYFDIQRLVNHEFPGMR